MTKAGDDPRVDTGAVFGDFSTDLVYVEVHIDPVSDCLLMRILHHKVLIEKTKRYLRRSGSEPDQVGIEVFQDLPPQVVD